MRFNHRQVDRFMANSLLAYGGAETEREVAFP